VIAAQDGTALVGHWFCPENAKRIIIAMHGWRSTWSQDFGAIAPFWFDNDCAVLLPSSAVRATAAENI